MLYLDNAATTARKPFSVYVSLIKNTLFSSGNAGRGEYKKSMAAVRAVVDAQDNIARLFNIPEPQNIIFTQNATYALNTAILGTVKNGGHIIITAMDHNSVLRPAYLLGNYTIISADKLGRVKAEDVEAAICDDTELIVCTHASNVCGTMEPVNKIGCIAKKYGVPFLVDAAQTAGCATVDAQMMNADMIAFAGHKGLMGPLGTGGLYIKNPDKLYPIVTGGTGSNSESLIQPDFMPDKFHSGTVNAPAIAALGKGVEYILKRGVEDIANYENCLAKRFRENLINMDGVTVYGDGSGTATVAFNLNGLDSGEVSACIGDRAAIRAGYHCAPLAHKSLGTLETGAVRVSFGIYNKKRDVDKITDMVYSVCRSGRGRTSLETA